MPVPIGGGRNRRFRSQRPAGEPFFQAGLEPEILPADIMPDYDRMAVRLGLGSVPGVGK